MLDACEAGDLTAVRECLKRRDIELHLNSRGFARNVYRGGDWLACGRGDSALHYAAFHGHAQVVRALLEAGAVVGIINDEGKSAMQLAKAGRDLLSKREKEKRERDRPPLEELPRGDPEQRQATLDTLRDAEAEQYVIVGYKEAFNGRVAKIVGVDASGKRRVIVDDARASDHRPWFQKGAVRSAMLEWPAQLRKLPRPPEGAPAAWPTDARFQCTASAKGKVVSIQPIVSEPAAPHAQPVIVDPSVLMPPPPAPATAAAALVA